MDILLIGIILIVGIILIEVSKHIFTRTILKFIIILIIGLIVFFSVLSTLDQEVIKNTDNEYIQTGASIIEEVNEKPLIIDVKENAKSFFMDIKEKIMNKEWLRKFYKEHITSYFIGGPSRWQIMIKDIQNSF